MGLYYTLPEGYTSPFTICPVAAETVAVKRQARHLCWDAQRRVWWCFDVRNFDGYYIYGWGSTPKAAYAMALQRLHYYLTNALRDVQDQLHAPTSPLSPYGPSGFLRAWEETVPEPNAPMFLDPTRSGPPNPSTQQVH